MHPPLPESVHRNSPKNTSRIAFGGHHPPGVEHRALELVLLGTGGPLLGKSKARPSRCVSMRLLLHHSPPAEKILRFCHFLEATASHLQ